MARALALTLAATAIGCATAPRTPGDDANETPTVAGAAQETHVVEPPRDVPAALPRQRQALDYTFGKMPVEWRAAGGTWACRSPRNQDEVHA